MKFILCIIISTYSCAIAAQAKDTVFHKIDKKYETTVLKDGLDYIFEVKYNGRVDTVVHWEYASYMGVFIYNILIDDDKFVVIHTNNTVISYAVFEYKSKKWHPFMGGLLCASSQHGEKIEPKIISKDKIQIIQDGNSTFYKLDFSNKTIEASN